MSIKLIYGNNGEGKSFYSDFHDVNAIVLNSYISKWYDEKTHKISELDYITKQQKKEIKVLTKKLTSANSSLSKNQEFNVNNFHEYLKSIAFFNKNEWDQYVLTNSTMHDEHLSVSELIDLDIFVLKYQNILLDLKKEDTELIRILSSLLKYEGDTYESKYAKKFNKQIVVVLENIKERLQSRGIEEKHFTTLSSGHLKMLFRHIHEIPALLENVTALIKNKIVSSVEYLRIKQLELEIQELKMKAIKFISGSRYKTLDDNYAIEANLGKGNYSEGQKAVKVLAIIAQSLEYTNKKIILDHFFENLDVMNQELAINAIIRSKKEFEVLTHNIKTVEIIQSASRYTNIAISENQVMMNLTTNKPEVVEGHLVLTFQSLCSQIWETTEEPNSTINIFVKMLGRYTAKAGSLTGDDLMFFRTNKNSQSWQFSANTVLHYDGDIDFLTINEKYLLGIEKNVNSIEMIEFLMNKIKTETHSKKYGLSYAKILIYLEELIKCLGEEKRYYDFIKPTQHIRANVFYENFWKGTEEVKPLTMDKSHRNQVAHQLDNSLLSITV